MPRSITPLLADQLDISEERAQSLLKSMVQELRHRAQDEGVQMAELGTFRQEDGTLTFVPNSSLRRRVNHQFEGLSKEDLAAPDDPESPPPLREMDDPEEPSETAPASDASEDDSIPTIDPIEETDQHSPDPDEESTIEPASSESFGLDEDEEESIPTPDPVAPTDEPSDADEAGPEETLPEDSPDAESEEADESESTSPEQSIGPVPVVGGLLLLLTLVGGFWFIMGDGAPWSSGSEDSPYGSTEPQAEQSINGPSDSKNNDAPSGEEDTPDQQTDRFAGVDPDDEQPPPDSDAQTRSWTIVVASQSSRSSAEDMASKYEGGFAPVDIVPGTVNDRTRYRVTLGRYTSETAARRALNNHASALPSDAWTHRLE